MSYMEYINNFYLDNSGMYILNCLSQQFQKMFDPILKCITKIV